MPDSAEWTVLPIGLNQRLWLRSLRLSSSDRLVANLIKAVRRFDHKGIFGHGLLVAGSYGKAGAAVLAAKAALRSGIGLLTCQVPGYCTDVLQASVPESMVLPDAGDKCISSNYDTDLFDAVGIGPGIGTESDTQKALQNYLLCRNKPLVIDADGINILSINKKWISALPPDTILTPHPKEFERISEYTSNSFNRLEKQIEFSAKYNCIVVLKGAYTAVTTPQGKIYFNNTGNPGMATAGSGDVLTGVILSLLARDIRPKTLPWQEFTFMAWQAILPYQNRAMNRWWPVTWLITSEMHLTA